MIICRRLTWWNTKSKLHLIGLFMFTEYHNIHEKINQTVIKQLKINIFCFMRRVIIDNRVSIYELPTSSPITYFIPQNFEDGFIYHFGPQTVN
jgi:hypothetical protein